MASAARTAASAVAKSHQPVADRFDDATAVSGHLMLEQAETGLHASERRRIAQLLVQPGAAADIDEEYGARAGDDHAVGWVWGWRLGRHAV